jgi:PAS domain S-box-containing protein
MSEVPAQKSMSPARAEQQTAPSLRVVERAEMFAEAGKAGADEKRAIAERRGMKRSGTAPLQESPKGSSDESSEQAFFLPNTKSDGMAVLLLVAYAIAALASQTTPDMKTMIAAALSIGLFGLGKMFAGLERRAKDHTALRLLLLLVGTCAPMAAAGYALACWVVDGLQWQWAIATLVCISAAAAALFEVRIVSLFCAKISMWAAFALIDPSMITAAALGAATISLLIIGRLEWKAAEGKRVRREARERVAARAEDILRSFEESGQGWFWETDRRGLLTYISPKAAAVVGKSSSQLLSRPLSEIVDAGSGAADAERTLAFHLSARSAFQDIELRAAVSGDERWWALTGRPVYDSFKNFSAAFAAMGPI